MEDLIYHDRLHTSAASSSKVKDESPKFSLSVVAPVEFATICRVNYLVERRVTHRLPPYVADIRREKHDRSVRASTYRRHAILLHETAIVYNDTLTINNAK